ncbi:sensor domain-containing protein [Thalassiella azotivora]
MPPGDPDGHPGGTAAQVPSAPGDARAHGHRTYPATADRERLAALVQKSGDLVATSDLDGNLTFLNDAGVRLLGLDSAEQVLGTSPLELFTDTDRPVGEKGQETLMSGWDWRGTVHLRHARTGEAIPVDLDAFVVTDPVDDRPLALAAVGRDLREQRAAQEALATRVQEQRDLAELARMALVEPLSDVLHECVERLRRRFPGMLGGVLVREHDLTFRSTASAAPRWEGRLITFGERSLTARALETGLPQHTADMWDDPRFVSEPAREAGSHAGLVVPILCRTGVWGTLGMAYHEVREWAAEEVAFVELLAATLGAAVQRQQLEDELAHQAVHDALTGLPNRTLAHDRIERALAHARRDRTVTAVLLLDLDDFKAVNDTLGHGAGDRLLQTLARRFEGAVRAGDTVARLGGDEFVVVCEGLSRPEDVAGPAEALLAACRDDLSLDGRCLSVTVSIGVAVSRCGEGDTERLLAEADLAMYRAKSDHGGTYRLFDQSFRGEAVQRVETVVRLREALQARKLRREWMPIVDVASGRVVALEALARWDGPHGPVPPDVFVPVAEDVGLVQQLGEQVLDGAVGAIARWRDQGHDLALRVNVSPHELRRPGYVDTVLAVLDRHGVEPGRLGLEITESTLVADDALTRGTLTALSGLGVTLLLDDFGTGYSSLSYLSRFPLVDVLKTDRSFLAEGSRGLAVVEAVAALARPLDLQVCAEGVERAEHLEVLRRLGCAFAQGYLISPPLPETDVAGWLSSWEPWGPST